MSTTSMGLGSIGKPDVIFKRKNRWTFSIIGNEGSDSPIMIPDSYVKIAAKPKMTIEQIEIPYKNATLKIPGKTKFENITVTYYDVAKLDAMALYEWVNLQNNQLTPKTSSGETASAVSSKWAQSEMEQWNSSGILKMYDGCGTELEQWTFHYLYPSSVDWGDLDYGSGEVSEITLELTYSEIDYSLASCIGNLQIKPCKGCV